MPLSIELTGELETRLREEAEREGVQADAWALDALQQRLAKPNGDAASLSEQETQLLRQINEGLPAATWQRYHELLEKRRPQTLSANEQQELIGIFDQIEVADAWRTESLVELSRLRGVPLQELMQQLGIQTPDDV